METAPQRLPIGRIGRGKLRDRDRRLHQLRMHQRRRHEHHNLQFSVDESRWQRRANEGADWTDVPGTARENQVCGLAAPTEPGEYRWIAVVVIYQRQPGQPIRDSSEGLYRQHSHGGRRLRGRPRGRIGHQVRFLGGPQGGGALLRARSTTSPRRASPRMSPGGSGCSRQGSIRSTARPCSIASRWRAARLSGGDH